MHTVNQNTAEEMESSDLLDCYRIALDFGMPAALRAYEKLTNEPISKNMDSNVILTESAFSN